MSERITENTLAHAPHCHLCAEKVVAEVRRLRALIVPMADGTTCEGTLFEDETGEKLNALVAEAEAIRAEEGK